MANVADYLTRHAAERPYALAIATPAESIHYATLERNVWLAAALLRRAGVNPGDVVGISLRHSPRYLVATYAAARIGAVHTPLPPEEPEPVRQSFVRRFGVQHVVAGAKGVPGMQAIRMTREALESQKAHVSPSLRVEADDIPVSIWRTSGTTGEAKGVTITHRMWLAAEASRAAYYPKPLEDRFLGVVEMSLAYGINSCERALYNGGVLFLPPSPLQVRDMLSMIDRHGITRLALTPNMLDGMLRALPADQCRCPGISDLSVVGMEMPEALRREIRRRFTPGLKVKYGSNEARYVTCADAAMQDAHPGTVGVAMTGVELQVVDDDDRPLPAGQAGRVRARAPWMATGYYNAPELDAGTFRGGWVHMGDIGVLSKEGMLFLKGRVDDMINYDSIKIMPADIEAVLLQHPAVTEVAAFPLHSRRHQNLPAAAVTLREDVSAEALRKYCVERLGKRAPTVIEIVKAMPRNAMGKILRREIAAEIESRLPGKS